jgi:hypothetical protein
MTTPRGACGPRAGQQRCLSVRTSCCRGSGRRSPSSLSSASTLLRRTPSLGLRRTPSLGLKGPGRRRCQRGAVLPLAKALGQARRPDCTVHERRLVRRWRRQRCLGARRRNQKPDGPGLPSWESRGRFHVRYYFRPRDCSTSSGTPLSSSARSISSALHRAAVSASVTRLMPASIAETVGRDQPTRSARSCCRRRSRARAARTLAATRASISAGVTVRILPAPTPWRHTAKPDTLQPVMAHGRYVLTGLYFPLSDSNPDGKAF